MNDAFGSAHRAHASTEAVAHLLPAYAGLLLLAELEHLGRLLGDVERPFVIVSGGAKVDDKVGVLQNLGSRADRVLIGGKMAEDVRNANPFSFDVLLPRDIVAAASFDADAETKIAPYDDPPDGWLGLDVGPETREEFAAEIARARTVFWNGPMGVFEWPRFAEGTFAVARAVADCDGYTIVGGGDSVRAVYEAGVADRISWISTGGGASLELLEGKEPPRHRSDTVARDRDADRRQLEDVQGPARGGEFCRALRERTSATSTSPSARPTSRSRRRCRRSRAPTSACSRRTATGRTRARSPARSRRRC